MTFTTNNFYLMRIKRGDIHTFCEVQTMQEARTKFTKEVVKIYDKNTAFVSSELRNLIIDVHGVVQGDWYVCQLTTDGEYKGYECNSLKEVKELMPSLSENVFIFPPSAQTITLRETEEKESKHRKTKDNPSGLKYKIKGAEKI